MQPNFEQDQAIRRLMAEYCFFLDERRLVELGMLFAEDGVWETPYARAVGPEGITAKLEAIIPDPPARMHSTTNIVIDGHESGFQARSYYLVVRDMGQGPQITVSGIYSDVFVLESGRWRFARRILAPQIVGDLGLK